MQPSETTITGRLDDLTRRLGPLFPRSETRQRATGYIKGLLSRCERKSGWQLAEWLGDVSPDEVQYLLDQARWDADAARDVLRQYVTDTLVLQP
jgi:SRSO17 transposase